MDEKIREALEDAVYKALEAGEDPQAIVAEVAYIIETAE